MQEPEPQSQKDPESIGSPFDPFALFFYICHCQSLPIKSNQALFVPTKSTAREPKPRLGCSKNAQELRDSLMHFDYVCPAYMLLICFEPQNWENCCRRSLSGSTILSCWLLWTSRKPSCSRPSDAGVILAPSSHFQPFTWTDVDPDAQVRSSTSNCLATTSGGCSEMGGPLNSVPS